MQENDQTLLEQIARAIVDKPETVVVDRKVDEMGVLLTVRLDDKDAGALIGRGGETIAAIRRIMKLVGIKENARINIKLDVPVRHKNDYDKPSTKDKNHNPREL